MKLQLELNIDPAAIPAGPDGQLESLDLKLTIRGHAGQIAGDFSGLPTSDPGGGQVWLNGGVLQVGA